MDDFGVEYKLITFGNWPQSKMARGVKITDVTDSSGYFLGDDGNKYARLAGEFYKVEPIEWRLITGDINGSFLVCDKIIAAKPFAGRLNNYAKSDIRVWLNGEFLSRAFSQEERERILVTEVDNGVQSAGGEPNPCVCHNTRDKIFLLSWEEAYEKFGFNDGDLQRVPTDYAKAAGVLTNSYDGCGEWWLRSPYCLKGDGDFEAFVVGSFESDYVSDERMGVVPAIIVRLPQSRI